MTDQDVFLGSAQPARLRDVAERVGVSIALVSSYINSPHLVGKKSAARIDQAIRDLDFTPNDAARQLRRGVSRMIAFVAFDVGDPFFASVARGAQRRAAQEGLSLVLADTDGRRETESEYLGLFDEQRIRGLLLAPVSDPAEYLDEPGLRHAPTVFIDQPSPSSQYASVIINDVLGGRLAGEHLLGLGRQRLAYIGGPLSIRQVGDRLRGLREAAAGHPDVSVQLFDISSRDAESGRRAGAALLALPDHERPDGVFCVNDNVAGGVLQTLLRDATLRVPEDIAVIGYNDVSADAWSSVPLTSVRQPHEEFGTVAVDLLIEEFAAMSSTARRHVVLDPRLVVRRSTVA